MNPHLLIQKFKSLYQIALCVVVGAVLSLNAFALEITRITADREKISIVGRGNEASNFAIVELAPYQSVHDISDAPVVGTAKGGGKFKINLPRRDGTRDRLYSGFVACSRSNGLHTACREIHFVEEMHGVARYNEAFPSVSSKKGLQVQMVDDAIALGVKHAALNVDLAGMVDPSGDTHNPAWELDGVTYRFHRQNVEALDEKTKTLSDAGIVVTLILLCYESGDPAVNHIMLHPHFSQKSPHQLSAFNTATPEGLRYFKACIEFLADRYSMPNHPHGRAVNFIVGNEVNAHWEWSNLGEATMEQFAEDYLRTVRICNTAVHKMNANSRVYLSLEHHWNIRMGDPLQTFQGRNFIDYFNQRARAGGNFDWNLAFHPYPEDLNEPRTWNDKTATLSSDTPRITFKNIEMLPLYFQRPELLFHGKPRHLILSEQGFNTVKGPHGEAWQAAAYCYAYYKISQLPGIDSFILHRHVDHRDEFGLSLGLWRRNEVSSQPSEPGGHKMIYEVFKNADTPQWRESFDFALPVIGIHSWEEIKPKTSQALRK